MKKYLLVSFALLTAAAFVWAEEATIAEPKIDVDAKASLEWGIDYGAGTDKDVDAKPKHGFLNKAEVKVSVPIIKKGDKVGKHSPKNDADVYAEFKIGEIELGVKNDAKDEGTGGRAEEDNSVYGKVKDISAKLVFHNFYLNVYDKPDFKTHYAGLWKEMNKDSKMEDDFKFEPGFEGFGTKFGYKNDKFFGLDTGIKFGSNGNWEGKQPEESKWVVKKSTKTVPAGQYELVPKGQVWEMGGSEYKARELVGAGTYTVKETVVEPGYSKYGIGFDLAMKPVKDYFEFDLGLNSTFTKLRDHGSDYNRFVAGNHFVDEIAFAFGAKVTSKPVKDLTLTLGFDGGSTFTERNATVKDGKLEYGQFGGMKKDPKKVFAWDMLFKAEYRWISAGLYAASTGTPYEGVQIDKEAKNRTPTADLAVFARFETKGEKKDDAKFLVKGLDAGASLGVYKLLSRDSTDKSDPVFPMLLKLDAAYKIEQGLPEGMWIKPYAEFWGETNHRMARNAEVKDGPDKGRNIEYSKDKVYFGVAYKVGVDFQPFEKVTLGASWEHGKAHKEKLVGGLHDQYVLTPANYNNHNGTFKLGVTVQY